MTDEDSSWLEARERGEAAGPHPRAEVYERLGEAVAALPLLHSPAGWDQRVLEQVDAGLRDATPLAPRASRRRRFALAVGLPLAAMAAAALLWWVTRDAGEPPTSFATLHGEIRRGDEVRRGATSASIGDTLVVRGTASDEAELWIYRDQLLVLRCPGAAACRGSMEAELLLAAPGLYRAILVLDRPGAPIGTLAEDLAALGRAGARAVTAPAIAVH